MFTNYTKKVLNCQAPVRTQPELTLQAAKRKELDALAVWYLARHIDGRGRGLVKLADLMEFSSPVMSPWRVRKALRKGQGHYFKKFKSYRDGETYLRLFGLIPVTIRLQHDERGFIPFRRRWWPVSLEKFKNLADLKAEAMLGWLEGREKGVPTSREVMAGLAGVSTNTTRNWQRRVREQLSVQSNIALITKPLHVAIARHRKLKEGHPSIFVTHVGKKRTPYVAQRLPNSYFVRSRERRWGRLKKVNRVIRSLVLRAGRAILKRVFFVPKDGSPESDENLRQRIQKVIHNHVETNSYRPVFRRILGFDVLGNRLWDKCF